MLHVYVDHCNLSRYTRTGFDDIVSYLDNIAMQHRVCVYSNRQQSSEPNYEIQSICSHQGWSHFPCQYEAILTTISVDTFHSILQMSEEDIFVFFTNNYGLLPLFNFMDEKNIPFTIACDTFGSAFRKFVRELICPINRKQIDKIQLMESQPSMRV